MSINFPQCKILFPTMSFLFSCRSSGSVTCGSGIGRKKRILPILPTQVKVWKMSKRGRPTKRRRFFQTVHPRFRKKSTSECLESTISSKRLPVSRKNLLLLVGLPRFDIFQTLTCVFPCIDTHFAMILLCLVPVGGQLCVLGEYILLVFWWHKTFN
jgi:hypothetical protein